MPCAVLHVPSQRTCPAHRTTQRLCRSFVTAAASRKAGPASSSAVHRRRAGAAAAAAASGSSSSSSSIMPSSDGKTRVLFVCLGNICRSPTAEAVFRVVVERSGLVSQFEIDSCGTGGGSSNWYLPGGFSYHEGDPADPRMTSVAAKRGVRLTSRSRPLAPADLSTFDVILGMDASNLRAIRRAAEHWRGELPGGKELVPADWEARLCLMTDYLQDAKFKRYTEVPDPYYGGTAGFELVLDLLEDACQGLLEDLRGNGRRQ